jgi:hypothetical protein
MLVVLHVEEIFEESQVLVRHAIDYGQCQLLLLANQTQKELGGVLDQQRQEGRFSERTVQSEG